MTFLKIIPGDDITEYKIFEAYRFTIYGRFAWDSVNKEKIVTIFLRIENNDITRNAYDYQNGQSNICYNFIKGNEAEVLELNFRRTSNPNPNPVNDTLDLSNENLILKQGNLLFINVLIYDPTEKIVKCKYSNINHQPRVKKGNILIGN
ncbi:hypothetical protein EZY14_014000 [Kordia sp. TARA_039_SRF]|nr:hypothetical protein EZY14_014000 [Kordia sp. TARA_039_SRF]